jgi:UDP-glucose 4-epimerase
MENRFQNTGCWVWKIGTGQPISVPQIKNTFEKINNVGINSEFVNRRAGDLLSFYANALRANSELGWTAKIHPWRYVGRQLELAKTKSNRL